MPIRPHWKPVAAVLALLLLSDSGAAQEKPQALPPHAWPMFGGTPARNMVNLRDKEVPTKWAVEGGKLENVKWVADLGTRGYGGPVVAGGRIFMGTNNEKPRDPKVSGPRAVVMCFDAASGKFLWQAVHDMPPVDVAREALKDGMCSTPTVEGDRLYYVTPACVAVCAEAATGKTLWQLDMMKDLKVYPSYLGNCAPLIVGDLVFLVTGNGANGEGKVVEPDAPSFVALHKNDGKLAWKSSLPSAKIVDGQWSNPTYAEVQGKGQVIFPGGDGWLYSLAPADGKLIWKFNCNPPGDAKVVGRPQGFLNYLIATPVVHDNKVYVGVGFAPETGKETKYGHFWCVDITKTGDVSPRGDNLDPAAPANKDSALVWHYGGLIMPRPKLGRSAVFGSTLSTAAVHDGLAYIAEEHGYLHCLDAATGKKYWEHDFKCAVWGSPYWVDGKVYIGTEGEDVVIFAHGKGRKVLGTINMDEPVLSTPVAVDGVLYVATKTKLYAIGKK
jgi:outer membrane protein assembly factor BamB